MNTPLLPFTPHRASQEPYPSAYRLQEVICGWCHKDMPTKSWTSENRISHGLCEECKNKLLKEAGL